MEEEQLHRKASRLKNTSKETEERDRELEGRGTLAIIVIYDSVVGKVKRGEFV